MGGPSVPMVQIHLFRECLCLPALHSCGDICNAIYGPTFHSHIPADGFEALTPKQLAGTRYVLAANEPIVIWLIKGVSVRCSNQSQSRIFGQLLKQEREVFFVE